MVPNSNRPRLPVNHVPNSNRPRLATLRLNLTTEVEWLIPNLILISGLTLHAAAARHCKTTEIFHAAWGCRSTAFTAAYAALLPSLSTRDGADNKKCIRMLHCVRKPCPHAAPHRIQTQLT